jgi:pimeloyl-ACP methyl ester carboxylesterase
MIDRSSRLKLSAGQIFWREAGDSDLPVVIFLHGTWQDSSQWQQIVDMLSKNFHCLAVDLIGFGNSEPISPREGSTNESPQSIALIVDYLHEFLDTLNLHPVYLVGHSLGAWIVASYALKYPDAIQGVVAISPIGFSLTYRQQYGRFTKWLLARPSLFRLWINALNALSLLSDFGRPIFKNKSRWHLFARCPTTCHLLFERSIESITAELVADRLSQFRSPFLVLQGHTEDQLRIEQSQAYAKAVWKSEYRLIEDISSNSSPELDVQIAIEIKEFFDLIQTKIDREQTDIW